MWRGILAMGIALILVLSATASTTLADEDDSRLGGAYRGPYEENLQERTQEEPDAADQGTSSGGPTGPDSGKEDTGGDSGGSGPVDDGTGGGDGGDGGDGGEGSAAPPPEAGTGGGDSGGDGGTGSSGPEAPGSVGGSNPPAAGSGGSGPNLNPGSGRGKVAQQDVQAYWMFWFEHNKEWILSELFQGRVAMDVPTSSSAWYFSGGASEVRRQPLSDSDRAERILPVLTEMSNHTHPWVRDAAVMALGKLGGEAAANVLMNRLGKEKKLAVRQDILLALGLTQEKVAVQRLKKELTNANHMAYAALGLALLGRPDESVPALLKEYKDAQKARGGNLEAAACLAVALGELGDEKVVEALATPIRNRGDNQLQVYACLALGKIGGDKARTWLFRALSSRDGDVQGAAVLALSSWNDSAVINYLKGKPGLKSGKRMSKLFALVSMGRIGRGLDASDAKRKLICMDVEKSAEGIQKDRYSAMYGALSMALMGDESSNKFFVEALNEGKKYAVENLSAIALTCGLLGVQDVVRDLREIARKKSEDQDLRGYALMALGIMGDTKSKDLVREIVGDSRPRHQVLRSGAWALGLLGNPSDVDLLLETLKRDGPGFHTARGAAALAIGMCGDATSVDKILKLVSEASSDTTRAFAISALGCLVDRESVPRIPKLFMNFHYRKQYSVVKQVLSIL